MLSLSHRSRARLSANAALAVLFLVVSADAANRVRVETISNVPSGATNLQIGVYVTNDVPITRCVLPLEIRTCGVGAYIAGPTFSHGINPAGRMYNSPLSGVADPNGEWPAAIFVKSTFAFDSPNEWGNCHRSLDPDRTWGIPSPAPDFVSPDAVFMATVSTGNPEIGEKIAMAPGTDPPGVPSYRIIVNVGMTPGLFVIDTTCIEPSNTIGFVRDEPFPVLLILPIFEQGVIGVGVPAGPCSPGQCSCPCHGDPADCLGVPVGILDVVTTIDVAFRGVPAVQSPACPFVNTDLDCTGATDIVDVVTSVNVQFRGANPASEYCNPCAF